MKGCLELKECPNQEVYCKYYPDWMKEQQFNYLGCYRDSSERDMIQGDFGGGHTPQTCAKLAYENGFKYFSIQDGDECFADNQYGG